ncbi:MAG TPA: diguanylate cyclase, partial [Arenimonas sp.]|nr:diguanylate cyclase [Arenimonas sp.]
RMNKQPRILIADDLAANRVALRAILRDLDVELVEAENGFDTVSLCLEEPFALILLDVQMPEMDGFEVCEQLRANPLTAEVPVIFLTAAFNRDDDKIQGYLSGATDYISKPVNDRVLRSKVEVYLRLYRQQQALLAANDALRQEVESRKRAEEELARQANTDVLTGIFNRRAFFDLSNQELARLRRYGGSACLAILDIDHFKAVNDTFGHQVGDQALQFLTATLAPCLRTTDIFARVGGEEFAVLLVQTGVNEALGKIQELLDALRAADFLHGQHRDRLSFSAGVSALASGDKSIDDAISRADKQLYRAKSEGRACVRA